MSVTNNLDIQIKAESQKAAASLDTLIAKLNEVDAALNGLNPQKISQISNSLKGLKGTKIRVGSGGGGSSSGSSDAQTRRTATLFDLLTASTNRANHSILNFRGSMVKLAATWGTFYAAMYPAIRLFKFFGSKVQDSMDYVETYNYFLVTMNKMGHDSGEEYLEGFLNEVKTLDKKMTSFNIGANGELFESGQKSLGLDPNSIMQFQARIGAVTNSVGLLGETSVATQKALTMLSSDLSSLKNEDLESVMTNLSSGLIGQSRALYKYGIDITNATLKTYAYEHGVTKAVSAMTQAEKMQLRILAILDQSKVAWGDQANTISSVANQYRIMKQQIANVGRVIGNLFLPIVQTVLPYLNAFIIAMRRILTLLGFKLYGSNWLKDLNEGISSGNFDGLVDDAEDLEDSLDGAGKSAKKLKQALMGFDELNIINPNESSSGGSGSGGASFDLSDDINAALEEYEKVWNDAFDNMSNRAEELANKIMRYVESKDFFGLGRWWSDSLTNILASTPWESVFQGAKDFGTGLADFLNGLITPELFYQVGRTVANSLNTALYFAFSFGKEFDFANLGKSIGAGINGFFETYDFTTLAETLNTWVDGLETALVEAIKEIKWSEVFKGISNFLTHLDFDTIAIVVGAITISKVTKILMSDFVKKAIMKKIAEKLADVPLGSALKITGGIIFTVKGLTMIFDSIQEGDIIEGLWGSLMTTGGAFILSGGNPAIVIPTLVVSVASVSFAWLQKPDPETGKIGLIKLLEAIKLPGGKGVDWDGKEVSYTTNLKVKLDEFNWWWRWSLPQKIDEKKQELKTQIDTYWDNFVVDVKLEIKSIKDGFEEKWNEFTDWWETTVGEWWDNDVKPWFTAEKWKEVGQGIKDGLKEKWDDFSEWWDKTGVPDWWNNDVLPLFQSDKWTFEGIKDGLKKSFQAAINGIKQLWNDFADWINNNLKWTIDPVIFAGRTIFEGGEINLGKVPKFNIPAYSIGGFPEDGLFMANHNELVGQFSNGQTAVANNQQIIEGIREGVRSAVNDALAPYLQDIVANTGATANNTEDIKNKPTQGYTNRDIAKMNQAGIRELGLPLRVT